MTKTEFQALQNRAASRGTSLKEFLQSEGIPYSTYNYWSKKIKAETARMPIAPISIREESRMIAEPSLQTGSDFPGVTLAFPNGVKAHFGRGSESVLMEVLSQSMQ